MLFSLSYKYWCTRNLTLTQTLWWFLQKRPKGPPYLGELHYFLIMIIGTFQNSKIWSQGSGYSLVFEHLPNVCMALGWVPQTHEETGRESEKRDGKEWEENGEQDRTETVCIIYVWVWYISLCGYKYVLSSWGLNPALLSKQSSTLSLAAWWASVFLAELWAFLSVIAGEIDNMVSLWHPLSHGSLWRFTKARWVQSSWHRSWKWSVLLLFPHENEHVVLLWGKHA